MSEQADPTAPPLPIPTPREDLCLDFANTLCWRGREAPSEGLSDAADLIAWLGKSAGLPPELCRRAHEWANVAPEDGGWLFAEAITAREAIYRTFSAVAAGEPAAPDDLALINRDLAAAPARRRVTRRDGSYLWATEAAGISVPALLAPVLWSAGDLLTRADRLRIRRCANAKCLWLFLDRSKGGTRRWCDMTSCGNRAKSQRHYLRTKPG